MNLKVYEHRGAALSATGPPTPPRRGHREGATRRPSCGLGPCVRPRARPASLGEVGTRWGKKKVYEYTFAINVDSTIYCVCVCARARARARTLGGERFPETNLKMWR